MMCRTQRRLANVDMSVVGVRSTRARVIITKSGSVRARRLLAKVPDSLVRSSFQAMLFLADLLSLGRKSLHHWTLLQILLSCLVTLPQAQVYLHQLDHYSDHQPCLRLAIFYLET